MPVRQVSHDPFFNLVSGRSLLVRDLDVDRLIRVPDDQADEAAAVVKQVGDDHVVIVLLQRRPTREVQMMANSIAFLQPPTTKKVVD